MNLDLFAFLHAGVRLAFDARSVMRVLRSRGQTAVPGAPAHLSQAFYESGRMVPLVDISLLLGHGHRPQHGSRIVLFEGHGRWLGICAETVLGPTRCDPSRLCPAPAELDPRIARAVLGVADEATLVIDVVALVDSLTE